MCCWKRKPCLLAWLQEACTAEVWYHVSLPVPVQQHSTEPSASVLSQAAIFTEQQQAPGHQTQAPLEGRRRLAQRANLAPNSLLVTDNTVAENPVAADDRNVPLQERVVQFQQQLWDKPWLLCEYLPEACNILRTETDFDAVEGCTKYGPCPCIPQQGLCPNPPPPPTPAASIDAWKIAVPVVIGVVLGVLVGLGVFYCCRRKRRLAESINDVLSTPHHTSSKGINEVGLVQLPPMRTNVIAGVHLVSFQQLTDRGVGVGQRAREFNMSSMVSQLSAARHVEHGPPGEGEGRVYCSSCTACVGAWCTAEAVLLATGCAHV